MDNVVILRYTIFIIVSYLPGFQDCFDQCSRAIAGKAALLNGITANYFQFNLVIIHSILGFLKTLEKN